MMTEMMATAQPTVPPGVLQSALAPQAMFTKDEIQDLLRRLREPFSLDVIQWVVTSTAKPDNGPKRGLLAPYADPRAYLDRLNEVFTPAGWTQEYAMQIIHDCPRRERGGGTFACAKLMMVCRVSIFGVGSHSGTGEQWADDENALTRADAQAFKRACVSFGLGRYIYLVPQAWVDLDEKNRPKRYPALPEWAIPGKSKGKSTSVTAGQPEQASQSKANGHGSSGSGKGSNGHVGGSGCENGGADLAVLREVEQFPARVGRKLFTSVVRAVSDVESPSQIADPAQLKVVLDRLQNAERGVHRLNAAIAKAGLPAHAAACRELKLASQTTDDIPDTAVLRKLIEKLEACPSPGAQNGSKVRAGTTAQSGTAGAGPADAPNGNLKRLRTELLAAARGFSSRSKQTIEQVIEFFSNGEFKYSDIGRMTEADLAKLQTALRRLKEAAPKPAV